MKYTTILFLALILASCGGKAKKGSVEKAIASKDLKQLKAAKSMLETEKLAITDKLNLLNEEIAALSPESNIPLVSSEILKGIEFIHYIELQGNVATKENLVLYPEYSGILTDVYVKVGQSVTKGQRLGKISDGGLSQQLSQLQIQTNLAKTAFERQARLWEQKIGTEMQYLQSKSNYESQQQAVNQIQQQLSKTIIKAPFSGTIDDIITEQGAMVSPGQTALFRVVNLSNMYIETEVPEKYISDITANKKVQVEFPVLGKTIESKVRQAGSYINPANRSFKIEINIPSKDKAIKPNLTAKVKINDYSSKSAILIPQSIISENAEGKQYVFVVTEKKDGHGVAQMKFVETGKVQDDKIEVLSGLVDQDEVIIEGARTIKPGQMVKLIQE